MTGNDLQSTSYLSSLPLKTAASLLLLPLLLAIALIFFIVVFADFLCFRLNEIRHGHPQPKGLWEF
jgi:hypothetical protein